MRHTAARLIGQTALPSVRRPMPTTATTVRRSAHRTAVRLIGLIVLPNARQLMPITAGTVRATYRLSLWPFMAA